MPALTEANFNQYYNATRPTAMTPVDMLINMSQKAAYVLPTLVRGRSKESLIKPIGRGIEEVVTLPDNGSFTFFTPGDPMTYPPAGTSKKITHDFRNYRSSIKWTKDEVRRNTGGERERFKDFKKMKEQERATSHFNGLEQICFRKPNPDQMEPVNPTSGAASGLPFSIPALVTEGATTAPTTAPIITMIQAAPTWTTTQSTVGGLSPSANTFWRTPQIAYDDTTPNGDAGIVPAFDVAFLKLKQWAHPDAGAVMQSREASELAVFTNADGVNQLKNLYRKNQDRWTNPNDPASDFPMFDGVSLVYAPQLDTELLGLNAGKTDYSGTAYKAGRPRFFIINRKYLKVCMDGMAGDRTVVEGSAEYPDTTFVITDGVIQLLTNNRLAHGIIVPGSAVADS